MLRLCPRPVSNYTRTTLQAQMKFLWKETYMGHRTKRILRIERKEYQTY